MAKLFANSGDPASDLGLHCLPITLLRVTKLKWVENAVIAVNVPKFQTFFIKLHN